MAKRSAVQNQAFLDDQQDLTSLDHQRLTSLDHQQNQAPFWPEFNDRVLPELVSRLTAWFGARHGLSPDAAVASAISELLKSKAANLRFESVEDLRQWLYTVAWRKTKDAWMKEHFDQRTPLETLDTKVMVDAGVNAAQAVLAEFKEQLNEEQRVLLDARLRGMTFREIQQQSGQFVTELKTLWKQITRIGKRQREQWIP